MTTRFYLISEEEEEGYFESEFGTYCVFRPNHGNEVCGWFFPDECAQLVGPFPTLEDVYDVASVYEP